MGFQKSTNVIKEMFEFCSFIAWIREVKIHFSFVLEKKIEEMGSVVSSLLTSEKKEKKDHLLVIEPLKDTPKKKDCGFRKASAKRNNTLTRL